MIISHSHKFILMSPWKTASSTCQATLEAYNESRYSRFFHFSPILNRVITQHITLSELLALPEGKLEYRIGAFVRNPYDRAYSGFMQIQRDFQDQPRRNFDVSWIGDLVRAQIAENMQLVISAGFEFDQWLQRLPEYVIFDVGRNSNMVLHPAHYWTHVNGEQTAGFIGKVEQFESDFAAFCEYVGIDVPLAPPANVSEDRANADGLPFKYSDRMSRKSIDRINNLFADDFEYFGYDRL